MNQSPHEPPDETDLAAWMIEYQRGDLEAFHRLFARLAPELSRYFAGRLPAGGATEDLVQETFLVLHRARRTYSPPLPVRPWVFGIARNVERHHRRRFARREAREVRIAPGGAGDAVPPDDLRVQAGGAPELAAQLSSTASDPLPLHDLRRALGRLPPSRREAWVLHHVHGFSFPEVAARLRIGLDAAKLRSSRAMSTLRSLLGRQAGKGG